MDKREMIERALGAYLAGLRNQWDALADQAIVIECEVEHILPSVDPIGCPNGYTIIDGILNLPYGPQPHGEFRYERDGLHGTPGKALAIILPLDKHNG